MPSVNDAYEAIQTALVTAFPNKTEIPNPYEIDENAFHFLKDGFSIAYGSASESLQNEYQTTWSDQAFDIKLTTEVITRESDAEPIRTAIKAIHADGLIAIKAILDPTLHESGITYLGTSAPELLNDKQIFSIIITVVARTQDNL